MTNTRPKVALDGQYNFEEAAQLLGVDRRTIYRWRKQGYLPETKRRRVNRRAYILGRHILRVYDALCS